MDIFELGDLWVNELLKLDSAEQIEEWANSPAAPRPSLLDSQHVASSFPNNLRSSSLRNPALFPPPNFPDEKEVFRGGRLFQDIRPWEVMQAELLERGIEVKDFLKRAIQKKAFDLFDGEYFDKSRKNVKFRGKTFVNLNAFQGERFENYQGCQDFQEFLEEDLNSFEKSGIIVEVKRDECFVLSPLNYIYDVEEKKGRLIFHFALNGFYSKPNLYLESPLDYLHELRRAAELAKFDLKKCYYQFPLVLDNRKYVAFEFKGRFFQFTVLPMGCSQSAFIVQNTNKTSARYFTLKTGQFSNVFLDDYLVIPSGKPNAPKLDDCLKKLGYVFSNSKTESGLEIEYCGYSISAE